MPDDHSLSDSTTGNWRAAALLGLVSSTFSTVVSQLAAARFGRDAAVDWMSVAAIPAREGILASDPSPAIIAIGILFHQWADFSWALVFFGVLGRWTAALAPQVILPIAVVWAVLTSATEWLLLVPVFPFMQPIFTLQQPYWIGFLVHLASALVYPLFPLFRDPCRLTTPSGVLLSAWSAGLLSCIAMLGALAWLGVSGHEIAWGGARTADDQTFMRHMAAHHAQGVELASLGAERAADARLRALARLMVASQSGEINVLHQWWSGWFAPPMPGCSEAERRTMPGFLDASQLARLRAAPAGQFDETFVELMTIHHAGAVKMADDEWKSHGGLRLRLMAQAIRHGQQGEIALMNGASGPAAVVLAVKNMMRDNINAEGP